MNYLTNAAKHFKKICVHKFWVGYYCFKVGLYWRGIKHDMSKFSPIEFLESIKYYQGTSSPIDACKKVNGWSKGWLHHRGRNDHHYEYWTDDFDHGCKPLLMPKAPAMELICDYLGAARAYMGKNFSYEKECLWWINNKLNSSMMMHLDIKNFITYVLVNFMMKEQNNEPIPFRMISVWYDNLIMK